MHVLRGFLLEMFRLGAISLAMEDVHRTGLLPAQHRLDLIVAETYGEEEESILQTALLWTRNVSAYIGPQETCVHEARMAAAFRRPIISYVNHFTLIYLFYPLHTSN